MCASDEIGDRSYAMRVAPRNELVEHTHGGSRICEVRGADLHARRARQHQLDGGMHALATPPTPTIGRSGNARWTSYTARTATGWMAGPDSPPPPRAQQRRAAIGVEHHSGQRVDERDRGRAGVAAPRSRSGRCR